MTTLSAHSDGRRSVCAITGTRAEFGLLRSVMRAIAARPELTLQVLVTGTHLLPPNTVHEVRSEFHVDAMIHMQLTGQCGRNADAAALGRGIMGFAEVFASRLPHVVLVLGDRIEAFAAAAAASVCGIRVAHMHGGDRAEGIADEALRHAMTKLAHLHLPATQQSAMRIIAMGEDPARVHIVGSPAIDGLSDIPPLDDQAFRALGSPDIVLLLHPVGDDDATEQQRAAALIEIASRSGRVLALHPNHDPGRNGIALAIEQSRCRAELHLPRDVFIGLLRRAKVLLGNSSAGLIEAAAIPIRCINVGRRQAGREMPANVCDMPEWNYQTIERELRCALASPPLAPPDAAHPYGEGHAGVRTAELLAQLDFDACPLTKRNTY